MSTQDNGGPAFPRQEENLQRGARVRVRCAHGKSADDVVWEDLGDVVMVCGPEQFARLNGGRDAPMPIGFRREDVQALDALKEQK